jgi:hypothetical protein
MTINMRAEETEHGAMLPTQNFTGLGFNYWGAALADVSGCLAIVSAIARCKKPVLKRRIASRIMAVPLRLQCRGRSTHGVIV